MSGGTTDDLSPRLPGRLGTPDLVIRDDPRADPRLVAVLDAYGMAGAPAPAPPAESSLEEILAFIAAVEEGFETLNVTLAAELPAVDGVSATVETVQGIDGNEISLYIHRPATVSGPIPAVLHLHGGGMVMLSAGGAGYTRWRDELAAAGLVAIGVEFRNAGGSFGPHAFPAGLNDCMAALQWANDHRDRLGISKLVVSGDSGGGNLSLASALKAKQEGRVSQIDGVYAQCPYISHAWSEKLPELASLYENDGLFVSAAMMGLLATAYDPAGANATNPLAWPYYATTADLEGLPPHVISVNELDLLRDEGLAYYRKLMRAGVSAVSRTVNGTCHAADCTFRGAIPDVYLATIRDIASFAHSL